MQELRTSYCSGFRGTCFPFCKLVLFSGYITTCNLLFLGEERSDIMRDCEIPFRIYVLHDIRQHLFFRCIIQMFLCVDYFLNLLGRQFLLSTSFRCSLLFREFLYGFIS